MNLKSMRTITILALVALALPLEAATETNNAVEARDPAQVLMSRYTWIHGPAVAKIKDVAEVKVSEGYMFTDAKGAQELLRLMGNPTSGDELGFLAPTNFFSPKANSWFVIYEFDDVGYVKDDEKDKLDADAMLKAIVEGNEYGNKQRAKMGVSPLKIVGWHTPPKYNEETHNLEWAINIESDGEPGVNYNTRLLGRKGVMEVSLVAEPAQLDSTLPIFRAQLKDYSFQTGQKYAEYKKGDKIAQYGLAALIVGGAAAGAAKLGLFAWLGVFLKKGWKLLVVVAVAVGAFLKRLLGFREPRSDEI